MDALEASERERKMVTRRKKKERKRVSGRKRAEERRGFDRTTIHVEEGMNLIKMDKAGTRRFDIIPFEAGEGNKWADPGDMYYERTFWIHRGIGPNNDSYVCPNKTAGKPCPICEYRNELQRDGDADEGLIKDLAPKERQLFNVLDREEPDKGVQVWDMSFHLFGKLLDAEIRNADEDEEYEYFADPEDGYTLKLGIAEKSFGGRTFCEVQTIGFKPRRQPLDEDVLEAAYCLDELIKVLEYDELKKIFLQADLDDDDDDDDDGQEEKPRRSTKKKTTRKPKKEPEPEEDDEEPEDEAPFEEEEEEKEEPKPRKRRTKKKEPEPEPDEEEEPEDEEEPDEEPDDQEEDDWDDWDD